MAGSKDPAVCDLGRPQWEEIARSTPELLRRLGICSDGFQQGLEAIQPGYFALPDSQCFPAGSSKRSLMPTVAQFVSAYFFRPIFRVRFHFSLPVDAFVASVPKTTVNEYGDPFRRKDDIRLTRKRFCV
jgi:hypothetical protein